MPERCEVVEVRDLADAVGYSCSRTASTQCSDCGIDLCEPHAENCGECRSVLCPSCFSFHQAEHAKPASADLRQSLTKLDTRFLPDRLTVYMALSASSIM